MVAPAISGRDAAHFRLRGECSSSTTACAQQNYAGIRKTQKIRKSRNFVLPISPPSGALLLRAGERVWERGVWEMLGLRAGGLAGRWENGRSQAGSMRPEVCVRGHVGCARVSRVCAGRGGREAHHLVETGRSRCLAMRGPGEGRGRRGDFPSSLAVVTCAAA